MTRALTSVCFTALTSCLIALAGQASASGQVRERPNILMILVDDLGWKDVGCYGNDWIETPRIDALAEQGVRFTDFYANGAVCSATRAAIQSGQYQNRFALTDFIPGHYRPFERLTEPPNALEMPTSIPTLGEAMRSAGYSTGYLGKWHLGTSPETRPENRGYDQAVVVGGSHFAPGFRSSPPQQPQPAPGTYQADYLTDLATRFLQEHEAESQSGTPFFLTVSYYEVHIPLQAKREKIAKYEAKPRPEGCVTHPVYAAMVEHVDENVGRLIDQLEASGLSENTLVVFTSDNGGLYTRYDGQGRIVTSQLPLRGEKGSLYEGGIRVPTIVKWPGVTAQGRTCTAPTMSIDFYPTFLAAAKDTPDKTHPLDGKNLHTLFEKPESGLNRKAIFWHYPHYHHSRPASAIRVGSDKLIHFYDDDSVELYDLEKDLGELNNLADSAPELTRRLRSQLDEWRAETGALKPYWNERYQPDRAAEWWNKMKIEPIDLNSTREAILALPFDGPKPSTP